ncbi:TetR/AcrR family transcriptional regulator [Marinobacterium marinum]|nr:TetR/AcrR family transcriptional regulator [Marinobacterium marinum]
MTQIRMSKDERREQLLQLAADIVRAEGTDRLTLQTLADRAGVSKPITYNHFGDRKGLLQQLYQDYDERLLLSMRAIDRARLDSLDVCAKTFSQAYFDCTVRNGEVYDAVVAALSCYVDFTDLRTRIGLSFVAFYREFFGALVALDGPAHTARLMAIYGASDELARALTAGVLNRTEATVALTDMIILALERKNQPS